MKDTKRCSIIVLAMGLGTAMALALLWMLNASPPSVAAASAELHVCATCPYTTVQAAVDAANDGDVIKVAAGTYTGVNVRPRNDFTTTGVVTQVVYVTKTVAIRGGYTTANWTTPDPQANLTTLDAQGQGRVFYFIGDISPTIDGLHITGGDVREMGGSDDESGYGGGLYALCTAITLGDNEISDNHATSGGGVYLDIGNAILRNNTIVGNIASDGMGGGVALQIGNDAMIEGNTVSGNAATDEGGGLMIWGIGDEKVTLRDNIIVGNSGGFGGGLFLPWIDATLTGNTIKGNSGDGLWVLGGANITLVNNFIADNAGRGVFIQGPWVRLLHNTIARNAGGSGIHVGIFDFGWGGIAYSTAEMSDNILVGHTVGIRIESGCRAALEATLWGSGAWANGTDWDGPGIVTTGTVNVWADPGFADSDNGDYHISGTSPARDAGVNAGVNDDTDGQFRPMGWGYDIGADEYPGAGLDVVKRATEVFVYPGQTLTYTAVITNAGTENAAGVVLTDTLDVWQRVTGVAPSGSCTIVDGGWGGVVVCSPGTMATGATFVVTLVVQVSPSVALPQAMTNTVAVRAAETSNSIALATYAQDCHVRINDGAVEYTTVQAAVDAASPGDVIKVAGLCVGATERAGLRQQVYLAKSLTVHGGYTTTNWTSADADANPTTLDALGLGRVLYVTGDITPTIEGLRITGGDAGRLGGGPPGAEGAFGVFGEGAGGGVYVGEVTATLRNNQIFSNVADYGGGLYLYRNASRLIENRIFDNRADDNGGGLYIEDGNAWLIGNDVRSNAAGVCGGGLHVAGDGFPANTLVANQIVANRATAGGGMALALSDATQIVNTVIAENTVHAESSEGRYQNLRNLCTNAIVNNGAEAQGSGVLIVDGSPHFLHTTIARNAGGSGVHVVYAADVWGDAYAAPVLTNTILVSHTVGISVTGGNTVTVNGILWDSSTPIIVSQSPTATVSMSNGRMGNPAFAADGYHITSASHAVDAGVNAGVTDDIDGEARPFGIGSDLGADEWATVETTVEPSAPSAITATVGGLTTTVKLPVSAVTATITLKYTALATTTHGVPSGLFFTSHAFSLDAYDGETPVLNFTFVQSVTITIHYADADVAGLDENTLRLEYWSESTSAWQGAACGSYGRHPGENYLTVPVCHLSQFALFGKRAYLIHLPLVFKDF